MSECSDFTDDMYPTWQDQRQISAFYIWNTSECYCETMRANLTCIDYVSEDTIVSMWTKECHRAQC